MVSGYTVLPFSEDTGYTLGGHTSGDFFHFSGVSDDEVFQQIPDSLLEAAKVDGAGTWEVFFRIGLPPRNAGSRLFADPEFHGMLECDRGADDILKTKSLLPVSLYLSNITANDVATAFAASIPDHGAVGIFVCLRAGLSGAGDSCIRAKGVST